MKSRGCADAQPKNIDVEIPRGSLTVITGLSGYARRFPAI